MSGIKQTTMSEIVKIELEEIKRMVDTLKTLDKSWAKNLADLISKKERKEFPETRVYNIVNSIVKHQQYRMLFVKYARMIIDQKSAQLAESRKAIL